MRDKSFKFLFEGQIKVRYHHVRRFDHSYRCSVVQSSLFTLYQSICLFGTYQFGGHRQLGTALFSTVVAVNERYGKHESPSVVRLTRECTKTYI